MSRGGVLVHPAIQRRKPLTARVGVLGVGLDIYWSQFPGLLETLLSYLDTFEQKVQAWNVETTNFGMVDNATAAYALLPRLQEAHLDLVFVDSAHVDIGDVRDPYSRAGRAGGAGGAAATLAAGLRPRYDSRYAARVGNICCCRDSRALLSRMGKPVPPMIIGTLQGDGRAEAEVGRWCRIAKVLRSLKGARIGHFGHPVRRCSTCTIRRRSPPLSGYTSCRRSSMTWCGSRAG